MSDKAFESAAEWEKAMEILLALTYEIPSEGSWRGVQSATPAGGDNTSFTIPTTGPDGNAVAPVGPSGLTSTIPADGGFRAVPSATPGGGKNVMFEVPNNHPAVKGPRTPLEWAILAALKNEDDIGTTWKTIESLVVKSAGINYTLPPEGAWQTKSGGPDDGTVLASTGGKAHGVVGDSQLKDDAAGIPGMQNLGAGPGRIEHTNKTGNPSRTTTDDGTHGEHVAMEDGSFFIVTLGDLLAKIDLVKQMDQVGLDPSGYQKIKRHIVKRAQDIVPDDWKNVVPTNWQLSMASVAGYAAQQADYEETLAKLIAAEEKKKDDSKDDDDKKKDDDTPPWLKKKKGDSGDDKKEKDSVEAYMARKFSDADRERLEKTGAAMPGKKGAAPRYPIENMTDLHNAILDLNRSKDGDKAAIRAHIISRAKALGAGPDLIAHIEHSNISK